MSSTPRFTLDSASQALYRPTTLQHPSNLRGLIETGKVVISTSLSYPSRHVAKTVAVTGADMCWLDAEHVAWSPKLLVECIQIIIHESGGKMIPVVRVPSTVPVCSFYGPLLINLEGIIIPHIETVEEIKKVIDACRFPPTGHRSFPPFTFELTDTTPEGDNPFTYANRHIAIIPQIESPLGIQNVDEIVALEEVSAFMIGHGDLRLEMGLPFIATGTEPEYTEAVNKAKNVSQARGKPIVGGALGPEMIELRMEQGCRVIVCCFDLHTFAFGMIKAVSEGRAMAEEYMQSIHTS
ncbi:Pyruvate/Phosphoenolpyruvate kinase-like domain-containing protein [Mycena galopus ATCC 62051]|nr:Pyruvate/Phosphoenolpyruvate kinase-like domain-containing protein [Mycena galopus ATCC 62051]